MKQSNRRLNPRGRWVIVWALLVGVLASGISTYEWARLTLSATQRRCLILYIETSIPLIKTVSYQGIQRAVGENVDPRNTLRVPKAGIFQVLHQNIFRGVSVWDVLQLPAKIAGVLLLASLMTGGIVANRRRRRIENGIKLRGPELMSIRQFNRSHKGETGMELEVYEK